MTIRRLHILIVACVIFSLGAFAQQNNSKGEKQSKSSSGVKVWVTSAAKDVFFREQTVTGQPINTSVPAIEIDDSQT
ncbi:MAG TPA: hypothetical protein VHO90_00675, partial [Bacteroidales bacterium]|nr:hypothetical protein [Bacteroidales bacterium]